MPCCCGGVCALTTPQRQLVRLLSHTDTPLRLALRLLAEDRGVDLIHAIRGGGSGGARGLFDVEADT